jgi:UDPglucose 6-dehydrogenase
MNVAIVGYGVVGKALASLFSHAVIYDSLLGLGSRDAVNACDVAFVCVPSPNPAKYELDTSAVEEVVSWLSCPLIILRSTVNPGTTRRLSQKYAKHIVFQPEYLGETVAHPLANERMTPFIILGGEPEDVRNAIYLYQTVYNASVRIRQVDSLTAEIIKLAENRAIAHRVIEAQELFDVCEAARVDYYTVREAVYQDDPRMSPFWTFIYPDRRGFNSKCIPKDIYAFAAYANRLGVPMHVTERMLEINELYIETSSGHGADAYWDGRLRNDASRADVDPEVLQSSGTTQS